MLNRFTCIGYLGSDPETITTTTGKKVSKFSLATTEKYKDRSGELKVNTTWHKLEVWENLASIVEKYLRKGSKIYAEGKVVYNTYEDKDGNKRSSTNIIVSNLTMLSPMDQENKEPIKREFNTPRLKEREEEVIPLDDAINDLPF